MRMSLSLGVLSREHTSLLLKRNECGRRPGRVSVLFSMKRVLQTEVSCYYFVVERKPNRSSLSARLLVFIDCIFLNSQSFPLSLTKLCGQVFRNYAWINHIDHLHLVNTSCSLRKTDARIQERWLSTICSFSFIVISKISSCWISTSIIMLLFGGYVHSSWPTIQVPTRNRRGIQRQHQAWMSRRHACEHPEMICLRLPTLGHRAIWCSSWSIDPGTPRICHIRGQAIELLPQTRIFGFGAGTTPQMNHILNKCSKKYDERDRKTPSLLCPFSSQALAV